LTCLEARVAIQEPVPQDYASRSFVHGKLKEVRTGWKLSKKHLD
jgi:hypothetical protein